MYLFCLLHICLIRFAFCNSVQGMMLNESKWRWKWEILSSPCKSLWSDRLPNWTLSAQKTTILVFRDLFLKLICNWGHGSLKIQGNPWKLSSWASLNKKYSIWKVSFTSASSWIFHKWQEHGVREKKCFTVDLFWNWQMMMCRLRIQKLKIGRLADFEKIDFENFTL